MATRKEEFTHAIQAEIKKLQEAYEAVKNLPDSVFDAVYSTLNISGISKSSSVSTVVPSPDNGSDDGSFSGKKGIIYRIIKQEGKAIRKRDILRKYQQAMPTDKSPENSVTFALSGLRASDVIKNYNESDNVKAGYWTLSAWWDGDRLLDDYMPIAQQKIFNMDQK